MKTAADIPAILTIHELSRGQYLVRIGDLRYRPLVVAVSKLLEDANSLVVITPADIKVLRVSGESEVSRGKVASRQQEAEPEAAGPQEEEVSIEALDAETQAAIREQEGHAPPGDGAEEPAVPEGGMRVVRRNKPNGRAGHPETCGRCRGEGKIRIIDDTGSAGEAACGVCQGAGVVTRYGSRR